MYTKFIKNIIPRFVCWILLLQMINISIDPPDLRQLKKAATQQKEDLTINEIESVFELVSECVFENSVPETEDNDIDTKLSTFDLYCYTISYSTIPASNYAVEHNDFYLNNFSFEIPEPNAPPPKYA